MLWTILLLFVFLALIWKLLEDEENPLDQLPGPKRRPIIGCTLEFLNLDARTMFWKMREFHRIFGDRYVIKIFKRRILHLTNERDIEIMLSHSKNIKKSKPYTFLSSWLGSGLLLSYGSKWHSRRKILTPTFHFNILKNFSEVIEEKSRDLVKRLQESEGEEVELLNVISDFTLYTICETAMGTQLDSDKSTATREYKTAITEIGSLLLRRMTKVWLHNEFLFRSVPLGKQFMKCLEKVHSFADNVIVERRRQRQLGKGPLIAADDVFGRKKRLAMLDLLLEAEEKNEIDFEGIREEVNTFMFEGHDTTSMAITYCLMLIADHEHVQDLLYQELQDIFGDSDRLSTMNDFAEMKYLEAVVKETLRLYPSVPFIAREITEDFMLDDLKVKKGSEVAVHIYDLHRRKETFPDPEEFRPERFLEGETRHPYSYVPFSAGPRNCIGQRFAMLEMKCVISEICRNYRLEPRVRGWRPLLVADMLLRPQEPIHVRLIKRN